MTFVEQQTPFVVLGMHRSGTSAIAGMLSYLGVDLGTNLVAGASDNELGFWEHVDLVQLNEWILQVLGASWEDARVLPAGWWDSEQVQPGRQAIGNIIGHDFAKSRVWGVKDPRLCRLVPLWNAILAESGREPLYVIVVRHPKAVAASLIDRNGFSAEKSYLLWLRYNLDAEYWTRGHRRVFVGYDDVLSDWRVVAAQIQRALEVDSLVSTPSAHKNIDAFLRLDLRHHRLTDETLDTGSAIDPELEEAARALYGLLGNMTGPISSDMTHKVDNGMLQQLSEFVDVRCKTTGNGPAPHEFAAVSEAVAAYLAGENKNIFLVIPTRNWPNKIIDCIAATYHKLAGPDTAVMIIRDTRRGAHDLAQLEHITKRRGIDVIDYDVPFDCSVMSRPSASRVYVIMHGFPCSSFAQLARYAKCRVMETRCGVNFVLSFKEQ